MALGTPSAHTLPSGRVGLEGRGGQCILASSAATGSALPKAGGNLISTYVPRRKRDDQCAIEVRCALLFDC